MTFDAAYRAAFIEPFASHRWGSRLELLQDNLAGPLATPGGCRHVYTRDDQYFRGVTDPETLRARLLEWHDELAARISQFKPQTSRQRADFIYMNSRLAIMKELIEALIVTERQRFERERYRTSIE